MIKTCTKCKESKSLDQFTKMAASKDGHAWYCKTCASAYARKRREEPEFRERKRENSFKFSYGITLEEYDTMFASQQGLCAICGLPETKKHPRSNMVMPLSVDHCHSTSQVRGLLCSQCNLMLGLAKDSPIILAAAIEYLSEGVG